MIRHVGNRCQELRPRHYSHMMTSTSIPAVLEHYVIAGRSRHLQLNIGSGESFICTYHTHFLLLLLLLSHGQRVQLELLLLFALSNNKPVILMRLLLEVMTFVISKDWLQNCILWLVCVNLLNGWESYFYLCLHTLSKGTKHWITKWLKSVLLSLFSYVAF